VKARYHAVVRRPLTGLPCPPRRAAAALLLLAACGAPGSDLAGTWESERDAASQVAFDGETVTMRRKGLKPTVYRQSVERTSGGYLLRWTKEDGETLRVEARLEGERLLLSYDGQEFALRRAR
jgi:hypothetical protein